MGSGGDHSNSVSNPTADMMMNANQNEIANSNMMKGGGSGPPGTASNQQIMGGPQTAPHQRSTSLSGLQQVRKEI